MASARDVAGVARLVQDVENAFVPDEYAADAGGEDAEVVVEQVADVVQAADASPAGLTFGAQRLAAEVPAGARPGNGDQFDAALRGQGGDVGQFARGEQRVPPPKAMTR